MGSTHLKTHAGPSYSLSVSPIFLIFVKFLFDHLIIMTRVWKVFFVTLQNVLNMHVKIAWDKHGKKITKPNECEGTRCTSPTKSLKDHNYPLICGQLSPQVLLCWLEYIRIGVLTYYSCHYQL